MPKADAGPVMDCPFTMNRVSSSRNGWMGPTANHAIITTMIDQKGK